MVIKGRAPRERKMGEDEIVVVNRALFRPRDWVVFLRVGGILNTCTWDSVADCYPIDRDKVNLLNGLLISANAKVVLTDSMRYNIFNKMMDLHGIDYLLRMNGLQKDRIVGVVASDDEFPTGGERISAWRKAVGHIGAYVVIDHQYAGIVDDPHPSVIVDYTRGLTPENITTARDLFQALMHDPTNHARP